MASDSFLCCWSEPPLFPKAQAQSSQVMLMKMNPGHGLPSFPGLVQELCLLLGHMLAGSLLSHSVLSVLISWRVGERSNLELFLGYTGGKNAAYD